MKRILPIIGRITLGILFVAAIYYFFYQWQPPENRMFFRAIYTNPLILIGFLGLYVRTFAITYFRNRLANELSGNELPGFLRSGYRIPRLYTEKFGRKDLFYRLYSWSLWAFLVLFLIGGFMVQAQLRH